MTQYVRMSRLQTGVSRRKAPRTWNAFRSRRYRPRPWGGVEGELERELSRAYSLRSKQRLKNVLTR